MIGGLSVTSISSRLLHVNETDEIGIKSGTMGFRGKVRNGKGGKGARGGGCVRDANGVCTRASRIASLSTRGYGRERKRRERRTRVRRGALCESRW